MSSLSVNITLNYKGVHKSVGFFSYMGFNAEIIGTQ